MSHHSTRSNFSLITNHFFVLAAYFTAPNVNPRTNCFCVSHPITMIGATANREAAESFAQKRPSGLEYPAMNTVSGAALALERLMLQNASFQARMISKRAVEESPGMVIGRSKYHSSCNA